MRIHRKLWMNLIWISAIIVVLCIIVYYNAEHSFSGLVVGEKRFQRLLSHAEMDVSCPVDLYFDGQHLIYDEADNCYYYSLVEDSATAYNPYVLANNHRVAFSSEIGEAQINAADTIDVVLYRPFHAYAAKLACTTLPVINISVGPYVVDGLDDRMDFESDTLMEMYLFDNRSDFDFEKYLNREMVSYGKIHTRGQTSRAWDALGYKISLLEDDDLEADNNKLDLLGIREDDDWILSSTFTDYDKVRNVFATNLWSKSFSGDNEWNVDNSIEYRFVEVFFDGKYHGLYGLTCRMDGKQVDCQDDEAMFKKKDWTISELMRELEYNEAAEYDWLPGYHIVEGSADDYEDLLNLYVNLGHSANQDLIKQSVDMDNEIDLWLFFKMTQAVDNIYGNNVKNIYVTLKNSDDGIDGKKLLIAPWDLDQTYNYWMEPTEDNPIYWSPINYLMFLRNDTICDEIRGKYTLLREDSWSDGSIDMMIDEYEDNIFCSGAYYRNMRRWPNGNYREEDYSLNQFREYVHDRLEWMDSFVGELTWIYAYTTE